MVNNALLCNETITWHLDVLDGLAWHEWQQWTPRLFIPLTAPFSKESLYFMEYNLHVPYHLGDPRVQIFRTRIPPQTLGRTPKSWTFCLACFDLAKQRVQDLGVLNCANGVTGTCGLNRAPSRKKILSSDLDSESRVLLHSSTCEFQCTFCQPGHWLIIANVKCNDFCWKPKKMLKERKSSHLF